MKKISLFFMFVFFLEGVFGESVSVMKGDSVTLNTGLSEIQKDDVLEWRFGAERLRIARINKAAGTTTYDDVPGGNFKDRLKLDVQTGSLTIMNSRTTDSAAPDSGLSPGGIAGIVVTVLLIPAAAAGGYYYCQRTKRQELYT
uniref:Si:ch73-27e22.7 n=1 Tax=Cyprinus carpio carpio TaxID=630221 RepID=A0A9J8CF67_CYPCA